MRFPAEGNTGSVYRLGKPLRAQLLIAICWKDPAQGREGGGSILPLRAIPIWALGGFLPVYRNLKNGP